MNFPGMMAFCAGPGGAFWLLLGVFPLRDLLILASYVLSTMPPQGGYIILSSFLFCVDSNILLSLNISDYM